MERKGAIIFIIFLTLLIILNGCIQQEKEKLQQQEKIQPPPECIEKKATDANLPESCKIWFNLQNIQESKQQQERSIENIPESVLTEECKKYSWPPDCNIIPEVESRKMCVKCKQSEVSENKQQDQEQQSQQSTEITVKSTGATYKTVSTKPTGWFTTGQDADIMISGIDFNNAGGPLLFNHPGTVASDGTHLLLADRNNNRILIWNKLPTSNIPPDLILGQKDFSSNNPGTGPDQMNWPVSVSVSKEGKLAVADTYNNRILIWNNIPTRNGQPADLVINSASGGLNVEKKRSIQWPWGVWTDGKKLAVSSTPNGIILLWNSFPTRNDQPADIYLTGNGNIGTPRTITSNGNNLIVGDHNAKVSVQMQGSFGTSGIGNFFWKNWPKNDDESYDFFMADPYDPQAVWMQGSFTDDGKLTMLGVKLHIWNSFPQNAGDKPDISVGPFIGGDGSSTVAVGNRLYLSLSNGNKIVEFNLLPTSANAKPDFTIGSPDLATNTLETNFIISNPVPATDGKSLFVSSDFDRKLYVWKNLPDESNAHPDFIYSLPDAPWDNELFGNALILAGKRSVYIWKTLPLNREKPDLIFENSIGNVQFKDLRGVALDDTYFYLSDGDANKIYVWEGIPSKDSNPKFVISTDQPWRLSSDGKYLVVTSTLSGPGGSIKIYRISDLSSNSQPIVLGNGKFNLPQGALVSQGHLFVGDTGFNRVLIWKNIEDAIAGRDADIILGAESLTDTNPEIGRNKLFWPANLAFDRSYLWIGEFKFSERLLRFSVY